MGNSAAGDEQYDLQKAKEHFTRYRRFERNPTAAGDLLSRIISRRGFTQEQFHDELQSTWQLIIRDIVGPTMAGKTRATMIKRSSLEVLVDSSPAVQQLGFFKSKLLKRLQTDLPDVSIKSIRFKAGKID